jgi:2-polyprenyl-6-methoxyphenol hydroxylase-like FAD-dependent oxidoreductase
LLQPIHWHLTGSGLGYRLILPQNDTEELLLEIADDEGVRIRRGETVVGLAHDENAVTLTTSSPTDERRTYRARYVVGADGGRSAIRALAGIDFVGHDGTFTGIIADVPMNMHWPDGRAMANNRHGWAASFPFGKGGEITRFNLVHAERRWADRREPVTAAEVRACVQEILSASSISTSSYGRRDSTTPCASPSAFAPKKLGTQPSKATAKIAQVRAGR